MSIPASIPAPSIQDAPALVHLLLSSPSEGLAHWGQGRLVPTVGTIEEEALADLVTLDPAFRPDLDLYFSREDLSDTLAATFDAPDPLWTEALDSFFTLWRRHAFSEDATRHADRLADNEQRAAQVLAGLQARLAAVGA